MLLDTSSILTHLSTNSTNAGANVSASTLKGCAVSKEVSKFPATLRQIGEGKVDHIRERVALSD